MWPIWLQCRQADSGDANWWLHLYQLIDVRIRSQPDRRAEWATPRLWLMRQAAARGLFGAADTAVQVAAFLGTMVREVGWVTGLPTLAERLRGWLAIKHQLV